MHCLKPGGTAVHTTEYNLSSDADTLDSPGLCIYRRSDMQRLEVELRELGHTVAPYNFNAGALPTDDYIDLPPYRSSPHLKIQLDNYVATSIGIIVTKRPASLEA
ncbi:MAG: hypothetical protein LBQ51_06450 [Desulfovibrio sp.]|jgi:hypothetical protein|nr:hypothetical protein [Desulfovibrio sp.]